MSKLRPLQIQKLYPSVQKITHQGQISASPLTASEHALAVRLGLEDLPPKMFLDALIHPSADSTNSRFMNYARLGSEAVQFFATEYFYFRYPKLPLIPLNLYLGRFISSEVLDDIAKKYGLYEVVSKLPKNRDSEGAIVSQSLLSLIGALYWHKGEIATRGFIHHNFCMREPNTKHPLMIYNKLLHYVNVHLKRLNKPCSTIRILAETGRFSNHSMFLVGLYSGSEKIGEGFAPSIKLATRSAAMNYLRDYYCEKIEEPSLPSNLFVGDGEYIPTPIEDTGVPFPHPLNVTQ